jgi:hypothetical protein
MPNPILFVGNPITSDSIGNPISDAIVAAVKKDSKPLKSLSQILGESGEKSFTKPSQTEFKFQAQPKSHWVWRLEYRIQFDDGKWSDWGVWIRQPNVFTRKCDAERRLAKIQTRPINFYYEYAVRPFYVGYDVREAKKQAKKVKKDLALAKMWAEQENNEANR